MKYLLLVIGLVIVYWLFKAHKTKARNAAKPSAGSEDMVRCAQCGLHLPRSESLASNEAYYCSSEHRRLKESAK